MKRQWTDEEIRDLLQVPRPHPDDAEPVFSEAFEARMQKLFAEPPVQKEKDRFLLRRAVPVLLSVLVLAVLVIGPDRVWAQTRAWMETVIQQIELFTEYRWQEQTETPATAAVTEPVSDDADPPAQPQGVTSLYEPEVQGKIIPASGTVPDGFSIEESVRTDDAELFLYTREDGRYILYLQTMAKDAMLSVPADDAEYREYHTGEILVREYAKDGALLLFWETGGRLYTLQSDSDPDAVRALVPAFMEP